MQIWSSAFVENGLLPVKYARDGGNLSPPLSWSDVPAETRELALLFESTTPSTRHPFAQWVLYAIAPDRSGLPEGFRHKRDPATPGELLQGTNDIGNVGYDGPQGVAGRRHRYRFRLLALNRRLDLDAGADRETLLSAAESHVLDESELNVDYERPR